MYGKHSKLQRKLVTAINEVVEARQIALAFPELRCTFGGRSIVPDVAVFAWERIPLDNNGDVANVFEAAPDWTIEILSPDQSQTKVTGNILHCLRQGSQLSWLIDPDERSVLIYPPRQQPELLQESAEALPVPNLVVDLRLTIGDLFKWLKLGVSWFPVQINEFSAQMNYTESVKAYALNMIYVSSSAGINSNMKYRKNGATSIRQVPSSLTIFMECVKIF